MTSLKESVKAAAIRYLPNLEKGIVYDNLERWVEGYIKHLEQEVPEITQKEVYNGYFSPKFAAGWNKNREQVLRFLRGTTK